MTIYHCLFEQSGTFKKEFVKLGFPALDYDIQNEFGETDIQKDLFQEIENAFSGKSSIFDLMDSKHDFVLAFFPCVRFETQIKLWFKGESWTQRNYDDVKKLDNVLKLHDELHLFYSLVTKLAIIMLERKIPTVIENPYSHDHYLTNYWPIKPKVIDMDRSERGDYYKKPTQYFFLNCEPKCNFIFEPQVHNGQLNVKYMPKEYKGIANSVKTARSMISPEYANRFIREYIINEIN